MLLNFLLMVAATFTGHILSLIVETYTRRLERPITTQPQATVHPAGTGPFPFRKARDKSKPKVNDEAKAWAIENRREISEN